MIGHVNADPLTESGPQEGGGDTAVEGVTGQDLRQQVARSGRPNGTLGAGRIGAAAGGAKEWHWADWPSRPESGP